MPQTSSGETIFTFDCKDSSCAVKVNYEREEVLGLKRHEDEPAGDKVVYLTCENGHTYPYTIKRGQ